MELEWDEQVVLGERRLRTELGIYEARILEGRVWRWRVGTKDRPDLFSGRIVGTIEDAKEACFHALHLCRLDELSDQRKMREGF